MTRAERHRAAQSRYRRSEKGRAKQAAWRETEAGRASMERYEASRVRICIGGFQWSYRLPPGLKREEWERMQAEFLAGQREESQAAREALEEEVAQRFGSS